METKRDESMSERTSQSGILNVMTMETHGSRAKVIHMHRMQCNQKDHMTAMHIFPEGTMWQHNLMYGGKQGQNTQERIPAERYHSSQKQHVGN